VWFFVPDHARPSHGAAEADGDIAARRGAETVPMAAWGLIVAVLRSWERCRSSSGSPSSSRARPCHLASLSQGDRAGTQSATLPPRPPRERRPAADFPPICSRGGKDEA